MGISLLTNVPALTVRRHLDSTASVYEKAMERIASGRRINRSGDDASGLTLSFTLEAKIRSIQQAQRNAQDALSLIQVSSGGMNEIGNILIRLRELSIQASSDSVSDREREMLELEAVQLKDEAERLSQSTRYLGTNLLNGEGRDFTFQIGIDNDETSRLRYDASQVDLRSSTLGIDDLSFSSTDSAIDALEHIDEGFIRINVPRALVGAMQSRIQISLGHLMNYEENLTAALSRIRDADLARETSEVVRGQILQKAGASVLAQANMLPSLALKLIEN